MDTSKVTLKDSDWNSLCKSRKVFKITPYVVQRKRNVMAHAQKPDLVFQRNGRVHLYRRGCQFSRLLAAEVCASAVVMLDRPCSHTVHECWLPTPFASFPFTSPPVLRRVPSDSVSTLPDRYDSMENIWCRTQFTWFMFSSFPNEWWEQTNSSDSSMRVRNVVYNIALHYTCLSVKRLSVYRSCSCRWMTTSTTTCSPLL